MQLDHTTSGPAPATEAAHALEQQRQTLPCDRGLKPGEPLPAPKRDESWDMRPDAPDLTITDYPTGPELTKAALDALMATNASTPYLFQRSGSLVRVRSDEVGQPRIELVTNGALFSLLARTAHWYAEVALSGGRTERQHANPPRSIASDIYNTGNWPVWPLYGLSPVPVLRADGSLHSDRGFDVQSGWWYEPMPDLDGWVPTLDTSPEGVRRAVAVLDDWLCDFPFEGPAEKATALALFLTLLCRTALDGNVPLFLIDAKQPRTGKTLLTEALFAAVLGELPALATLAPDEAEIEKCLATCLLHGRPYLIFDNVRGRMDSPALASLLTSGRYSKRLLGGHEQLDVRVRLVIVATANQVEATSELLARSVRCQLNANMSRPQDRTGFRHPAILTWTLVHRRELIEAGFTLVAAWRQAGQTVPSNLPAKGGYEDWARVIGGTLAHAGIPGFLTNEQELFEESDQEGSEMQTFLLAWLAAYQHESVKVGQLYQDAQKPSHPLCGALPQALAEVQTSRAVFQATAGKFLVKHRGGHVGSPDMWLDSEPDTRRGGTCWRVLGGPKHVPSPDVAASNGHEPSAVDALLSEHGRGHHA